MCLQKWQLKGTGLINKLISMEEPHIVKADNSGGNTYCQKPSSRPDKSI